MCCRPFGNMQWLSALEACNQLHSAIHWLLKYAYSLALLLTKPLKVHNEKSFNVLSNGIFAYPKLYKRFINVLFTAHFVWYVLYFLVKFVSQIPILSTCVKPHVFTKYCSNCLTCSLPPLQQFSIYIDSTHIYIYGNWFNDRRPPHIFHFFNTWSNEIGQWCLFVIIFSCKKLNVWKSWSILKALSLRLQPIGMSAVHVWQLVCGFDK